MYFLLPLIFGIVFIGVLSIFIYMILRDKKHPYSWFILVMLIIILCITLNSLLEYTNVL